MTTIPADKNAIKFLRAASKALPPRRRRPPPPRASYKPLIVAYYKNLKSRILAPLFEIVRRELIEALPDLYKRKQLLDGLETMDDVGDELAARLAAMRKEFSEITSPELYRAFAQEQFERVSAFNARQIKRQVKALTAVDVFVGNETLQALSSLYVQENVALIKTIGPEYFDRIENTVFRNFRAGLRPSEMEASIQRIGEVTTNRARLIARDQTNKLNGDLTKARHRELGIEKFIWNTAGDDRVRDSHADLDQQEFSWNKGSDGIFPGQEIQCRCWASPAI